MAKKTGKQKPKIPPPPICKAILLCDSTIVEAGTGKVSIIGVFGQFTVLQLPGRLSPFTVFLQLIEGVGRYDIVVEFQDLRDNMVMARADGLAITFPARLMTMNVILPVPPVPVVHSGEYEIVVFANAQEIDRQRVSVRSIQEMTDANENG
ncbi:MAG: hypothetical protein WD648_10535 [Planctomycetaceae bacterium]